MQYTITTHKISHNVTLEVPYGSTILQLLQYGSMVFSSWPSARVVIHTSDHDQLDKWTFIVVADGESIPDGFEYIGSIVHPGNPIEYSHWAVSLPE